MTSIENLPPVSEIKTKKIKLDIPFHKLASFFSDKEGTVLLQSGGDMSTGGYSMLAVYPEIIISSKNNLVKVRDKKSEYTVKGDPLTFLKNTLAYYSEQCSRYSIQNLPVISALFGYLSYDLKNSIETLPNETIDDLILPDMYMTIPRLIIIRDTDKDDTTAVLIAFGNSPSNTLSGLEEITDQAVNSDFSRDNNPYFTGEPESNFSKEEYTEAVSSIIEYIKAGDIYQVNMSQRFSAPFYGNPFSLYCDLFEENPASFFSFMNCGDHFIVSTSPERFIKQTGRTVEARPIKGTRPRGGTETEDENLKRELLDSKKDEAELSMIVDLLRNDIGKVCKAGSVKVTAHKTLESYKNVHHLVSYIEGEMEDTADSIDLIKAAFPGGSITGCPKIRAMEIIEEKEPVKRHIYTGSIGYIGFNGVMDLSIAIRTAVIYRDRIYFSAGGGIVYDSVPEEEYLETLHKARSFLRILSKHNVEKTDIRYIWQNGKTIREDLPLFTAANSLVQYGKGVFETILVKEGQIMNLDEHIKRLETSCTVILKEDLPPLSFDKIIDDLIYKNKLKETEAKVKIIAGTGSITVTAERYIHRLKKKGKKEFFLGIYPHTRGNLLFSHKTNNYLFNLIAGRWAEENGFDEAVILNTDGSVSETNTGNLILVKDKTVILPESEYVLPGIEEITAVSDFRKKGYTVIRMKVFPDDLKKYRIFITNSLIGMTPAVLSSDT